MSLLRVAGLPSISNSIPIAIHKSTARPHLQLARALNFTAAPHPFARTSPKASLIRRMASSAPKYTKPEWLVIAPDFEGAIQKRLDVRPQHLAGLGADPEHVWLWGGAMLEEPFKEGETPKFKGSVMLIGADTKEEVIERLKKDIYVENKVWDWEKIQIIPFKSAVRKPL